MEESACPGSVLDRGEPGLGAKHPSVRSPFSNFSGRNSGPSSLPSRAARRGAPDGPILSSGRAPGAELWPVFVFCKILLRFMFHFLGFSALNFYSEASCVACMHLFLRPARFAPILTSARAP